MSCRGRAPPSASSAVDVAVTSGRPTLPSLAGLSLCDTGSDLDLFEDLDDPMVGDTANDAEDEEQGSVLERYYAWQNRGPEQTLYTIVEAIAKENDNTENVDAFVEHLKDETLGLVSLMEAVKKVTAKKRNDETFMYGVKYLKRLKDSGGGAEAIKKYLIERYTAWKQLESAAIVLQNEIRNGNGDAQWNHLRNDYLPREYGAFRADWTEFVELEKERERRVKEQNEGKKRVKDFNVWKNDGLEKTLYDMLIKIFTDRTATAEDQLGTEMNDMLVYMDGWDKRLLDRVSTYTTTNKTRQSDVEKEKGIIQLLESWVILSASDELRDFVQGVYEFGQQLLETEGRLRSGDAQWNDVVDVMNKARVDLQNKIEKWKEDARKQVVVKNDRIDALAQEQKQREEKAEEMRLMFQMWLDDGWEEQLYNMLKTIFTDGDLRNADGALKDFVNTLRHESYKTQHISDTDLPEANVLGLRSDYEKQLLDKIRLYVNSRKPSQDLKDIGAIDMLKELVADETKTEEAKTEKARQFVIATYDDWMSLMSAMNDVVERGDTAWDEFDSGDTKAYMEENRRLWREKRQAKQAEKDQQEAEKAARQATRETKQAERQAEKAEKQAEKAEKAERAEKERERKQAEKEKKQTEREEAERKAAEMQRSSALKTFNDSFANATEDMFNGYYDSVKRYAQEKSDFSSSKKEEAIKFLEDIPGYMTYETQDGTRHTLTEEQRQDALSNKRLSAVVNAMWRVEDGGDAQRQAETEVRAALHNALNSEQKRSSRNSLTNGSVAQARAVGGVFPEDTWNALKDAVGGDIRSVIMYRKMQIIQNYVDDAEKEKRAKIKATERSISETDDENAKEELRWGEQYFLLFKDATVAELYDPIVEDLAEKTRDLANTLKREKDERDAQEKEARRVQREAEEKAAEEKKEKEKEEKRKVREAKKKDMAKERADAAKKAKAARLQKKEDMRAKAMKSIEESLKGKLQENALLAIFLAQHEEERVVKQEQLDRIQGVGRACEDTDDFPWLDEFPTQPIEERKRSKWFGEVDEKWPVAQVPLTPAQHKLLFITEGQLALLQSDGASDTATVPPDSPAAVAMEEEEEEVVPEDEAKPLQNPPPPSQAEPMDTNASVAPFSGTGVGGVTSGNLGSSNIDSGDSTTLSADEVMEFSVLLFNKSYARCILAEHLRSIKTAHRESMTVNPKAEYVDVAGALGPLHDESSVDKDGVTEENLAKAVEMLLPTFEALLRYRNTILKVKEMDLTQQILMQPEEKTTSLNETLKAIRAMDIMDDWKVPATLMLQGDRGQLPGQLYIPQPSQLPLRISAPPRVGKSATALLVASIAKRVGMCCFYSVSPAKKTPIDEMKTKLTRIGWRSESKLPDKQATGYQKECKCTRMLFRWTTSDEDSFVKGVAQCKIPVGTLDSEKDMPMDFILYSSDVLSDVEKVGALLSHARNTTTVIFHIRDEAQSLAKQEKNDSVNCHKIHVPPPKELQYLRSYYGNLFGLNCLVTATLFPTLLEEGLWGFFGSVSQNVRAGLPLTASVQAIRPMLGSKYLPKLTPALRPYISPGYIGIEALEEWRAPEDLKDRNGNVIVGKGTSASLEYGARFSGVQSLDEKVWRKDLVTFNEALWWGVHMDTSGKKQKTKKDNPADADWTPEAFPVQSDASPSVLSKKEEEQRLMEKDERLINAHFLDWLVNAHEKTIDELSSEEQRGDEPNTNTMVPMYLGALNVNIVDDNTVSFIRHFGTMAHARAKQKRGRHSNRDVGNETYGVAFLLYTTSFPNNATLKEKGNHIKVIGEMTPLRSKKASKEASNKPSACNLAAEKQTDSLVVFTYLPDHKDNKQDKRVEDDKFPDSPHFVVFKAPSADVAIEHIYDEYKISKIAILGYSMLEAGLTVQTVLDVKKTTENNQTVEYKRVHCPQYVTLATANNAALDAQLQIAGRTFVELKRSVASFAPTGWRIQLLGTKDMANRLRRYSDMESTLALIAEDRMYKALKEKFNAEYMADALGKDLGVVGVRKGSFGSILGITVAVALDRVKANAKKQEARKRPAPAPAPTPSV